MSDARTPAELVDAGLAAAIRGELDEAAAQLTAAADGFLAAGDPARARVALSNLASVRKHAGDAPRALAAIDEAIALLPPDAPDGDRGVLLLTRAGVLDRLAAPEAAEVWSAAARAMHEQPLMQLACRAHAAGARVSSRRAEAIADARDLVRSLGPTAPLALVIGVFGAVGDSAPGAAGIPFLAQAAWAMVKQPETCNPSNAPFLEMLAERLGYDQPLSESLAVIGVLIANTKRGTPDYPPVMSHVGRMLHRAAAIRGVTPDDLLELRRQRGDAEHRQELAEVNAALESLIGDDWLVQPAPVPLRS